MAWTAPVTWSAGQTVTEANLNEQLRDNMIELKTPPGFIVDVDDPSADYTTTSTTFADVDVDLSDDITPNGDEVAVTFVGTVTHGTAAGRIYFNVAVDGTPQAANDGICMCQSADAADRSLVSFTYWIQGLSAGVTYTVSLQWKTNTGTATMYAGAGTSNYDLHPQFVVREIS